MLIIVEGCDGSGKSTLVQKLRRELPYNWVCQSQGYPRTAENASRGAQWLEAAPPEFFIICDRHPLLAERVYGPIIRNENIFLGTAFEDMENVLDFLHGALVIYCRPPITVIEQGVRTQRQMEGVSTHLRSLVSEYDLLMREVAKSDGPRVVEYNWEDPRMRIVEYILKWAKEFHGYER